MFAIRMLGATVLALSVSSAGAEPVFISPNSSGAISAATNRALDMTPDGRFVLFTAEGDDMLAGDSNGKPDLLLLDRTAGTTELISVGATPAGTGDTLYTTGSVSADGRYVIFTALRVNLVAGVDAGNLAAVYVRDRVAQQTRIVSVNDAGEPLDEVINLPASISDDGRYVAFSSTDASILEGEEPPQHFLVDLTTSERRIVSRNRGGSHPSIVGVPGPLHMSGDGRWLVFGSLSLLSSLPPDTPAVYLYDRDDDSIVIVSRTATGELNDGDAEWPDISRDGRYITFFSSAANLTGRPAGEHHFLRKDRVSGALAPIDIDAQGQQSAMDVTGPTLFTHMSADGRFIAFESPKLLMPGLTVPLIGKPMYVRDMENTHTVAANMNLEGDREGSSELAAIGPLTSDGRFMLMTGGGKLYPSSLTVPDDKKFHGIAGDAFLQDLSPLDVRAEFSPGSISTEAILTVENLSSLQATLLHIRLTSSALMTLEVAIPANAADECRGVFDALPIDCYIKLLPGTQQTTIQLRFNFNGRANADVQATVNTNEPDSNAANNTANVRLTALTPPPASGGGGGGGALGWLELAGLGGGLRLLQKLRERRAFRSHLCS